jgi:hypothetical protein
MIQTGGIVVLGETFRWTKRWDLNRKKKVPGKKEMPVPEGARSKLVP